MRAKSQYYEKHWSPRRARLGVALLDVSVVTRLAVHRVLRNRERSARWEAVWRQRSEWHPPRMR